MDCKKITFSFRTFSNFINKKKLAKINMNELKKALVELNQFFSKQNNKGFKIL